MTYDFTNKSDREELHGIVKRTIEGHRNNIKLELTVNSLKCIERLIETQEKIIEDQEERIAIMSEGEKHGHWIMTNMKNVYGGIVIKCSCCDSRVIVQSVDDEKFCRTCGASMDEPPKEGDAE